MVNYRKNFIIALHLKYSEKTNFLQPSLQLIDNSVASAFNLIVSFYLSKFSI